MIKAIIFDCFGVFYPDPVLAFTEDPRTDADVAEKLHLMDRRAALGSLSKAGFVAEAAALLGYTPERMEETLFEGRGRNDDLISFAKAARRRYKIGLLSNIGADMMDGFFSPAELSGLFDAAVLSGAVGLAKPDPKIFTLACERLGVVPGEAVMVDDRQGNVDAARALGMQAILYKTMEGFWTSLEGMS